MNKLAKSTRDIDVRPSEALVYHGTYPNGFVDLRTPENDGGYIVPAWLAADFGRVSPKLKTADGYVIRIGDRVHFWGEQFAGGPQTLDSTDVAYFEGEDIRSATGFWRVHHSECYSTRKEARRHKPKRRKL